jgi:uncharacterized protein YbjT (DUF2867 family)
MVSRRIFLAGSSGAVGRTVARLAAARGVAMTAHLRPRPDRAPGPGVAVCALDDAAALDAALAGHTTIVQTIGTMRRRFAAGDTYASSDVGTTRLLVEAARRVGGVDHLILLSSVGAGNPRGAYLRAKAEAEAIVSGAGIDRTILRPSFFVGEGHRAPPIVGGLLRLGPARYRPVAVEALAAAILRVAADRAPLGVLEGGALHALLAEG